MFQHRVFSLWGLCLLFKHFSIYSISMLTRPYHSKKRKYLKDCPLFTCIHMFFMSPIIVWILGFDHIWYYEQRIIANLCIIDLEDYRSECNHVKCTGIWEDTHLVLTVFFFKLSLLRKGFGIFYLVDFYKIIVYLNKLLKKKLLKIVWIQKKYRQEIKLYVWDRNKISYQFLICFCTI